MLPETLYGLLPTPRILLSNIQKECVSKFDFKVWKDINPQNHKVNLRWYRPQRRIETPDEDDDTKVTISYEDVNRIPLPLQRLIVTRGAAFLTGGRCTLAANAQTDAEKKLFKRVKQTWKENKLQYKNNQIARKIGAETECAEIWYTKKDLAKLNAGKRDEAIKIKCNLYSPGDGYSLYPIFDSDGDLIAFGMKWEDKVKGERYFHLYIGPGVDNKNEFTKIYRYIETGTGLELSEPPITTIFRKLPVIYYSTAEPAWQIVQPLIERLEDLISNFADTNDYNGSPILFASGEIRGFSKKGETGKVLEGHGDASLQYVTWESAPESIKLEISTLLNFIYTCTQTPDISFEQMKGLGDLSGVAFDRIMIDAHLKAIQEQDGYFGECIQRRVNLIEDTEAFLKDLGEAEDLEISPIFSLFRINGLSDAVDLALKGNGNKPVFTREQAVDMVGISEDTEETVQALKDEEQAEKASSETTTPPAGT